MMVTLPRTDSSMMKLRPVIALMNLARTGISTFWKFIVIVLLGEIGGVSAASDPNAIKLRNTPATVARKKRLTIRISPYWFRPRRFDSLSRSKLEGATPLRRFQVGRRVPSQKVVQLSFPEDRARDLDEPSQARIYSVHPSVAACDLLRGVSA